MDTLNACCFARQLELFVMAQLKKRRRQRKVVPYLPQIFLSGSAHYEVPQHLLSRRLLGRGVKRAPAAICRKVAEAQDGGVIEIWGDGKQTRSFLYIDECLKETIRLMRSGWTGFVNIGSQETVTISQLAGTGMGLQDRN